MIELTRRNLILASAAVMGTGLFRFPALAQAANALVVTTYGGVWEAFWRDALVPAFVEATGAEVTLDVGFGRTYTANLRAAGPENPPYSMIMTNEIFAKVLRNEGYFEKLDLSLLPNYADTYPIARQTEDHAVIGMISPLGIGYRTDLVSTPPTKWRDLWENPEFKGLIGLYNIVNSAGKMMVMLSSQMFGADMYDTDAGFAALAELGPVLQTDFNMSTMMSTGEIVVAPYDFGEIARLKEQGLPVDCVVPEEGMIMWDQTFSICNNAPARELAYQYVDFILAPETQLMLAREFYVSPTNSKVEIPDDLKAQVPISGAQMDQILNWDWDFANANVDDWTRRWNETFGA
jgi:putative spermidine/putrescine transport system substrate-binding protein